MIHSLARRAGIVPPFRGHPLPAVNDCPLDGSRCCQFSVRRHLFLQDFPRRVVTGSSRNRAAGMRSGAAQPQTVERRAIGCPGRNGAAVQHLVERHVDMSDGCIRDTRFPFNVGRSEKALPLDEVAEAGRVALENFQHGLDHVGSPRVPRYPREGVPDRNESMH